MTYEEEIGRCYLRLQRRKWNMSQRELARYMGLKSSTSVSRLENAKHAPTLEGALACQVLFGIPPAVMWPHVFDLVEDRVIRDVYERHEALSDTTSPAKLRKRELYALAIDRARSPQPSIETYEA